MLSWRQIFLVYIQSAYTCMSVYVYMRGHAYIYIYIYIYALVCSHVYVRGRM